MTVPASSAPRALVVRSGVRPFLSAIDPPGIEITEAVSHAIEPMLSGDDALDRPARLAIFTSRIAVERIFEDPVLAERFGEALEAGQLAAVGPVTEEALLRYGRRADLVASGSGEDVLGLLPRDLSGWRVLLPRGDDATSELPEELARRGALPEPLLLYRKVPRPADPALEREIVSEAFGAFCPTSPSAARWLFHGVGSDARAILRATPGVALGRFTRRFLEALGVERVAVTAEPTFAAAARLLELLAAGDTAA